MTQTATKPGSNAERSRSSNRQAVLGRIQSAGQLGRAEIARALGLSTQAVSNIIADLERDGLLAEVGRRSGARGLPATQYGVNAEGGYAFGFEIRPDAVFAALVDLNGTPVQTARTPLSMTNPRTVVPLVKMLSQKITRDAGISPERVMGAGIVIPGPFGRTGLSGLGSDLPGWEDVDARALFSEAFDLPVELSNDANAAAMSERLAGGLTHFAYLYFGAGLGLGLVSGGQLVEGAFGNAGEIGHVRIQTPDGPAPLETRLSRIAMKGLYEVGGPSDIDTIAKFYAAEDSRMMDWLAAGTDALSQAVALIENLFDPQTIILGGAMPEAVLDHLIAHTELPAQSVSNRAARTTPRLQRGTCGRMTATLGAAALILNRAFTPQAASL